jgi:hypothetical protein
MKRFLPSSSPSPSRPKRSSTPVVENLEGRQLLYSTLGSHFTHNTITYSFVPDGTNIGGSPSNLFGALASEGITQAQVETAFEKAAAEWQLYANVNLVLVSDNGEAYGATGDQQGDPNVGDIRIGGSSLSGSILGEAFYPPPTNGGTLSGDIVMNTSQSWSVSGGNYDLETVALHEIGHALGMGHSTVTSPWPVMAPTYNGVDQALTTDDQQGIQSIWGTRTAASNSSSSTAQNITSLLNGLNQVALPNLAIANASNSNWFYVVAPITGPMTVTMQTANLSSLSPKFSVYTSGMVGLTTASAANSYGATISATVQVTAGQGYYIRAMQANPGPGAGGAYGLQVNFNGPAMTPFANPDTPIPSQPDQGSGSVNDSIAKNQGDTWEAVVRVGAHHPRFVARHNHVPHQDAGLHPARSLGRHLTR